MMFVMSGVDSGRYHRFNPVTLLYSFDFWNW